MAVIADRKGTARRMKRIVCDDADVFFFLKSCAVKLNCQFSGKVKKYIYIHVKWVHIQVDIVSKYT